MSSQHNEQQIKETKL